MICGTHLWYNRKHTRWNQNRPIIKLTPNSERNIPYLTSVSFLGFELVVPSFLKRFSFPPPPPQREKEREREREREREAALWIVGRTAKNDVAKRHGRSRSPSLLCRRRQTIRCFPPHETNGTPSLSLSLSLSLENLNSTVFDLILCLFIYIGLGRRRRAW